MNDTPDWLAHYLVYGSLPTPAPVDDRPIEVVERNDWLEALTIAIRNATARCLDDNKRAAIGASGGLDSSLIMASCERRRLHAYHLDIGQDEEEYASYAIDATGQWPGGARRLDFNDRFLKETTDALGEPAADPATQATFMLARWAAEDGAEVLLSGLCADEMTGSYGRFVRHRDDLDADNYPAELTVFRPSDVAALTGAECDDGIYDHVWRHLRQWPSGEFVNALGWMDLQTYAHSCQRMTSKLGSAVGLEVRYPFADPEVTDLLMSMPTRHKMGEKGKVPLKRIAESVFGDEFANRAKRGFGAPIREWVCKHQRAAYDVICTPSYIDNEAAARVVGDFSHPLWAHRVWALYVLGRWEGESNGN